MQPQRTDPGRRPAPSRRLGAVLAGLAVLAAACGGGDTDDADNADGLAASADGDAGATGERTVEVAMTDNEFSPARIEVRAGDTVRFAFTNEGAATHDAVIGDEAAQARHEEEMRAAEAGAGNDDMHGMDHGAGAGTDSGEGAITVEPGGTGELTHTFASGDELVIGCHEPGHYDAGMRIAVAVSEA